MFSRQYNIYDKVAWVFIGVKLKNWPWSICAIPAKVDFDSIPIPLQWCSIQFWFQFHPRIFPLGSGHYDHSLRPYGLASIRFWFLFHNPWKSLKSDSNSNSGIRIAHNWDHWCYKPCESLWPYESPHMATVTGQVSPHGHVSLTGLTCL